MLKSYKIYTCTNGALGLHLSRAPWDPYPWVSSIQKDSTSYQAGLRTGDCLLELNGQDVLGMKICEIAALLKNHWLNESSNYVTAVIWRNKCNSSVNNDNATRTKTNDCNESFNGDDGDDDDDNDDDEDEENNAHNINQQSLQKFATCLQHIAQLLECPVCLEVIKPPGWQCCNGHVLCNNCRSRSEKCPVCRVPLGPRGRCLLSDKLFTLLADSFPCDGVRSNKNSPKGRRKCSTEFHNQPKMAIIQKQQQEKDEQQGAKKAKDFLFTSLRHRRRKLAHYYKSSHDANHNEVDEEEGHPPDEAKEENKHPSMQKQAMYNINAAASVVVGGGDKRQDSNRKSSLDSKSEAASIVQQQAGGVNVKGIATTFHCNEFKEQTSTIQQCHCITCFKSDGIAIVNNVTATTTASAAVNKYILRIPSEGQLENIVQQQQQEYEEKYKNYQCPTGKLCCLNVNVMPHATCTSTATANGNSNFNIHHFRAPVTNKHLSTTRTTTGEAAKQTALMAGHHLHQQQQVNGVKFHKILKTEWEILAHLTEDHQLPVNQYYAAYGQRILVPCLAQQRSINCINLKGLDDENEEKVDKFFIACIPLEKPSATTTALKVAVFLYHMNSCVDDATTITSTLTFLNDEVSNFETVIENPQTGIKWFGNAHPLTTPWSCIREKQHFHQHHVLQNRFVAVSSDEAAVSGGGDDAFVIVVKRKLKIKT